MKLLGLQSGPGWHQERVSGSKQLLCFCPWNEGERFLVEKEEETLLTKPPAGERRGQWLEVFFERPRLPVRADDPSVQPHLAPGELWHGDLV